MQEWKKVSTCRNGRRGNGGSRHRGRVLGSSAGDRIPCAPNLSQGAPGQANLKRRTGQREGLGCLTRNGRSWLRRRAGRDADM